MPDGVKLQEEVKTIQAACVRLITHTLAAMNETSLPRFFMPEEREEHLRVVRSMRDDGRRVLEAADSILEMWCD